MKKQNITLIIIVLSVVTYAQECINVQRASIPVTPGESQVPISKLQTGHFSFENVGLPTRYRTYRQPYKQRHELLRVDVSLTISFISGFVDRTGLDFSIRPIVKDTYFDAFFTMNTRARWVTTHIHFVVSSRQDFVTGSLVATNQGLLQISNTSRRFTFKGVTTGMLGKNAYAYATISGIKVQQLQFQMKLSKYIYLVNSSQIVIEINILRNLQPIQLLQFSYFAYITGEFFVKDLVGSGFNYILKFFFRKKEQSGVSSIISMAGLNGTRIQQLFNLTLNLNASKPTTIAGAASQKKRLLVDSSSTRSSSSSSSTSGSNTGSLGPITEQNILQLLGNRTFAQLLSDPVLSRMGFFDSILPASAQYSGTTQTQATIYQQSFIVGQLGQIINKDLVQIQTAGSLQVLRQTIKKSPNICVTQEQCFYIGGKSIQIKNGFICQLCPVKDQFYNNQTKACQCTIGFALKNQRQCVLISRFCAPDEQYNDGQCYKNGVLSRACDETLGYVANAQKTQCICQPGLIELANDANVKSCVKQCKQPFVYNFKIMDCTCPSNSVLADGKCQACSLNQIWSATEKRCKCKDQNSKGQCEICSLNAKFNKALDKCVCVSGYQGSGYVCVQTKNSTKPVINPSTILAKRLPR